MYNNFYGPDLETLKAGDTLRVVEEEDGQGISLRLEKIEGNREKPAVNLAHVEIPANAYALIKELSEYTRTPIEQDMQTMILAIIESWLEAPWIFECTEEYLDSLRVKHKYNPAEWRKEAS